MFANVSAANSPQTHAPSLGEDAPGEVETKASGWVSATPRARPTGATDPDIATLSRLRHAAFRLERAGLHHRAAETRRAIERLLREMFREVKA